MDLPNDSNEKVAAAFPIPSDMLIKALKLPDPRITPDELVSVLELANERGELRDWLLVNRHHGYNRIPQFIVALCFRQIQHKNIR